MVLNSQLSYGLQCKVITLSMDPSGGRQSYSEEPRVTYNTNTNSSTRTTQTRGILSDLSWLFSCKREAMNDFLMIQCLMLEI